VPLSADGLSVDGLAAALADHQPVALFLQPRAHNPTGVSMTRPHAEALSALLAGHPDVTIVEDDHAGDIAAAPPVSLGCWLPSRTVHVSSFSKSHGPDLRLAAIGGPAAVIAAVADRRLLGPGWSSRILQAVLLDLLTDPAAVDQVAAARAEYARRRAALLAALADRGVPAMAADGINMWLPVHDQQAAMVSLAAHGVAVAPGAPFQLGAAADHVRLTVGLVRDGFADLADTLTTAAGLVAGSSGSRARPHPRGWR
jgi:DNA-binding transcriptional MocR family regulator